MRTNWIVDTFKYMFGSHEWTVIVFDLLMLASIAIAVVVYRRFPLQRTTLHVWTWIARLVMGAMWWQQVIWKVPPDFEGLRFWTQQMVQFASTDLQKAFVSDVGLAHFGLFAPIVFLTEFIIAVTLMLGLWSRFGSILGAAMALNLAQGLYRSPSEWPWQYVFLLLLMVQFSLVPPGRSLGIDVLLAKRDKGSQTFGARLLRWFR